MLNKLQLKESTMAYPKVLIIHSPKVNFADANADAIVLRTLFQEWPRENLHQIFYSNNINDIGFFKSYYCFKFHDRRFGYFYDLLFGGKNNFNKIDDHAKTKKMSVINKIKSILKKSFSGFIDIVFFPIINKKLKDFLDKVRPDFIYTQGYTIRNINLTLKIASKLHIPYIIHPLDDWAANSLIENNNIILKYYWKYYAKRLFNGAAVRLAVSKAMKEEYEKRYKNNWHIIPVIAAYNNIEHTDYKNPIKDWKFNCGNKNIAFCYTGSLGGGRNKAILQLANKLSEFNSNNVIKSAIFLFTHNLDKIGMLIDHECIIINGPVESKYIPLILEASDILLIAESFEICDAKTNKFVLSSKVPFYTKSNKPILVIGNENNGTVSCAMENQWGLTLTDINALNVSRIFEILISEVSQFYTKNAIDFWEKQLNPVKIRKEFLNHFIHF